MCVVETPLFSLTRACSWGPGDCHDILWWGRPLGQKRSRYRASPAPDISFLYHSLQLQPLPSSSALPGEFQPGGHIQGGSLLPKSNLQQ